MKTIRAVSCVTPRAQSVSPARHVAPDHGFGHSRIGSGWLGRAERTRHSVRLSRVCEFVLSADGKRVVSSLYVSRASWPRLKSYCMSARLQRQNNAVSGTDRTMCSRIICAASRSRPMRKRARARLFTISLTDAGVICAVFVRMCCKVRSQASRRSRANCRGDIANSSARLATVCEPRSQRIKVAHCRCPRSARPRRTSSSRIIVAALATRARSSCAVSFPPRSSGPTNGLRSNCCSSRR
jgi:hypothetical protein